MRKSFIALDVEYTFYIAYFCENFSKPLVLVRTTKATFMRKFNLQVKIISTRLWQLANTFYLLTL